MEPTPEEAGRTLAEARRRESQVRSADARLAWILALLAAAALGIGILMSVAPRVVGPAVAAVYVGAIVAVALVFFRIRAYSRPGLIIFTLTSTTFTVWQALISGLSVITGWWSAAQPNSHFAISEALAVVPLLVGIGLLSRRRG